MITFCNNTYINVAKRHWLATLDNLRQENAMLQNRLAQALKSQVGNLFLQQAEELQQQLIQYDQLWSLLKQEMKSFSPVVETESRKIKRHVGTYDFYILERDIHLARRTFATTRADLDMQLIDNVY